MEIHPSSIVSSSAKIAADVKIGPFCVIGPDVEIGEGCVVASHVVMQGHLKIGKKNKFFQFCSIGEEPQDLGYKGEPTRVEIGDNNVFREYVSIHRGTLKQDQVTKIGNNGLFMAYVHIGHDVTIGNQVRLVNSVNVAGHVHIHDNCIIGGGTNISQFISLGRGAYIGGASGIDRDIPPFCAAYGNRIHLKGINIIGLKRMGKTRQQIAEVIEFYRTMESSSFSARAFVDHSEHTEEYKNNDIIQELIAFIKKSEIGIAQFYS
jgi:UDP-N-acetylglucosamine acyltransferase